VRAIATIGYQAATIHGFLDALQEYGTGLLVDIRAVASSRRPGFSKTALAANLHGAQIDYLHLRGLGTPADGRVAARAGRHDEMKAIYLKHLATPAAQAELEALAEIVRAGRRTALMCFEADHTHCHRSLVATALASMMPLRVSHLDPSQL
jgi:uncharacterized protein (DUF488 family)